MQLTVYSGLATGAQGNARDLPLQNRRRGCRTQEAQPESKQQLMTTFPHQASRCPESSLFPEKGPIFTIPYDGSANTLYRRLLRTPESLISTAHYAQKREGRGPLPSLFAQYNCSATSSLCYFFTCLAWVIPSADRPGPLRPWAAGHSSGRSEPSGSRSCAARAAAGSARSGGCGWPPPPHWPG